jgi:serine/threonine-protein kinase PpkA
MSSAVPEIPGYQLLRALGEGGMATVYLALQKSLDRKVAIKILRTANDDDPERTERRFLREGRILAKITHRNVCGIYDIAKVGDVAYIAMEFLDGGTLVDRQRTGISVGESIAIVVQVASALQEAHNQGIVHRDLKPANVMMRGGKVPVLTDFGIAREVSNHQTRITTENMIVGTPVYMSPEQVTGGEIDGRSDIYSLGIMFYELLTGTAPYTGDNPIQVCMQHLTAPVPQLPPELNEINAVLSRMLAKTANDRFATMSEFTHALRDVFVASQGLRAKAELAPNQPWTEQLRQMGFSFDTLRDGELNVKLREQQKAALAANRAADSLAPGISNTQAFAKPTNKTPLWIGLSVGAALLAGTGIYFATRPESKSDQKVLNLLAKQFDAQINAGQLFEPVDDNAADTLATMRDTSERSKKTLERVEKFTQLLRERISTLLATKQQASIEAADKLYNQALAAEVFNDDVSEELFKAISDTRNRLANEQKIAEQQKAFDTAFAANPEGSGWNVELNKLQELLSETDAEFKKTQAKAAATLASRLQLALSEGDLDRANRILALLRANLANVLDVSSFERDINAQQAKLSVASQVQSIQTLLAKTPTDIDSLSNAALRLSGLLKANPNLPEAAALKANLVRIANSAAMDELSRSQSVQLAKAYVSALGEFSSDDGLKVARLAIAQKIEQIELAKSSGTLLIDTIPYSRVISVTDASGKAITIPANASTPLKLIVRAGIYRVELQNALGESKSLQVSVQSQQMNLTAKVLNKPLADEYLREAGY